jgi:hypothetical protein
MRANWILTTAAVAMSVTAAAGAQSAKAMHQPSKDDTMRMTYTGCVTPVNHGAAFLLTKADTGSAASMHGDKTMKQHDMAMKSDAAKTTQDEQTTTAAEKMDPMSSKSFALAGSTDLSKHVGQKVAVTGSLSEGSMGTTRQDLLTLTIKTLKVIATSCS